VRPTANAFFFIFLSAFLLLGVHRSQAQENSPYSRYGLGDLIPQQNILNRAMGGISTAYADYSTVNFANPASYAELKITSFDIGLDYNSRTLKALNPPRSFQSAYLIPSYFQLGLPLSKTKNWGMNLGLRPISRINYDIRVDKRLEGIDSVRYTYQGNGGTYQAFTGLGYGNKHLNVGFNVGYMFGTKEYASRINFLNDTIPYKSSNTADSTRFGGIFFNAGVQYKIQLSEKVTLRLGAHGNLQTTMRAKRNITRQTAEFSPNTGLVEIDSIYTGQDESGTIIHPSSWGAGFVIHHETQWLFGGEINFGNWSNYRYYGAPDNLVNNWTARLGAQILPNYKSDNYFSRVAYRVGASFGPDNVKLNNTIPQYSFTFGAGLPVRRNVYTNQYTTINTAFEIGFRGNRQNDIRESLFRVSLGLNLSDVWFNKPKYQ
jgi:hypothetical protein